MKKIFYLSAILLFTFSCFAQSERTFEVDGVKRKTIIYEGTTKEKKPLVLVFHGHGGNARIAQRRLAFHDNWKA